MIWHCRKRALRVAVSSAEELTVIDDLLRFAIDEARKNSRGFDLETVQFVDIDLAGVDAIKEADLSRLLHVNNWARQHLVCIRLLNLRVQPNELLRSHRLNLVFPLIDESNPLGLWRLEPKHVFTAMGFASLAILPIAIIAFSIWQAVRGTLTVPWNGEIDSPIAYVAGVLFVTLAVAVWLLSRPEQ